LIKERHMIGTADHTQISYANFFSHCQLHTSIVVDSREGYFNCARDLVQADQHEKPYPALEFALLNMML
jgi:hypothetical protein